MGNIEKYGVVALLFVIVMVVAVSIWGPKGAELAKADPVPAIPAAGADMLAGGTVETGSASSKPEESVAKPLTTTAEGSTAAPIVTQPAAATLPEGVRKYKIQKGDTLEGIAYAQLGKKSKVSEIVKLNEGLNPSRLRIGQEILLPGKEDMHVAALEASAPVKAKEAVPATTAPKSYKTTRSDTLYDLAKKFYGNGGKWKKIYDANKNKIADPDSLPEGVELTIP